MAVAPRTYAVVCRCGATAQVAAGQAGGTLDCPACGGRIEVPRLRDLAPTAVSGETGPRPTEWRPRQAWMLVGCVVAALGSIAALAVGRLGDRGQRVPDEAALRAQLAAADAIVIHRGWYAAKRAGVDRGGFPNEVAWQRSSRAASGLALALWGVAAAGGLVAVVAAVAGGSRRGAAGVTEAAIR